MQERKFYSIESRLINRKLADEELASYNSNKTMYQYTDFINLKDDCTSMPLEMVFENINGKYFEIYTKIPIVAYSNYEDGVGIYYGSNNKQCLNDVMQQLSIVKLTNLINQTNNYDKEKVQKQYEKFALKANKAFIQKKAKKEATSNGNDLSDEISKKFFKSYNPKR